MIDEYRMKLLNIRMLPDKATPKTTLDMTKDEIRRMTENGLSRSEMKSNILKLYYFAMCVDCSSKIGKYQVYNHYYNLLHCFIARERC